MTSGSKKSPQHPGALDCQVDQGQITDTTQIAEHQSASMNRKLAPSLTAAELSASESLLQLFQSTKKQLNKASIGNIPGKPHRIKKQPQRVPNGFGYIGRLEIRRKCQTCATFIKSGTSAIRYHETARGKGAGKTSYCHASTTCLSSIDTKRKEEFIEKKWSERHVGRLAEVLSRKVERSNLQLKNEDTESTDS